MIAMVQLADKKGAATFTHEDELIISLLGSVFLTLLNPKRETINFEKTEALFFFPY